MFKAGILILALSLASCNATTVIYVETDNIEIDEKIQDDKSISQLIQPYRDSLELEMHQVIATAKHNFTKGRPNGSLNNWSSDAVQQSQSNKLQNLSPSMSLLNVGGLRNPISIGEVTVGDMFKLMPFDNEVVIVELPVSCLDSILNYLRMRGGEPIGGAKLANNQIIFNNIEDLDYASFYVVTSDYLMNGGDNMTFFQNKIRVIYTGKLLRDVFIEEAIKQSILIFNNEERIVIKNE